MIDRRTIRFVLTSRSKGGSFRVVRTLLEARDARHAIDSLLVYVTNDQGATVADLNASPLYYKL